MRQGTVVRYWDDGWYTATVVKVGYKHAHLQAIVPYYRKHKDGSKELVRKRFRVPIANIRLATIGDLAVGR